MANIKPLVDIENGVFVKLNNVDALEVTSGLINTSSKVIRLTMTESEWFDITNDTTNTVTLSNTPYKIIDVIYNKSIHLRGGNDYTLSGNVLTFSNGNFNNGDVILVIYDY